VPSYGGGKPRFKGVAGADDMSMHKIVYLKFSDDEAQKLENSPPVILAIVGDVEVINGGLRLITVRKVLRSLEAVKEAKAESNISYAGTCGSSFAEHWLVG
jgi:hypothetical protein